MCYVDMGREEGRSPAERSGDVVPVSPWLEKIAWVAIVAAFPFFFIGGPSQQSSRVFTAVWNFGHIIVFLLASLLLLKHLQAVAPRWRPGVHVALVFFLVAVIGGGIELLQYWEGGRSPSTGDMCRNMLGCFVGLVFLGGLRPKIPEKSLFCLRSAAVLLVCIASWPFVRALTDITIARVQFPVLSSFETPFEQYRWKKLKQVTIDETVARQGEKSLKVQLTTKKYSGVSLSHFPGDWRQYKKLCFSVFNPDPEELRIVGRIHDVWHKDNKYAYSDRFNREFFLRQGWNDIEIVLDEVWKAPRGRKMDMQQIEAVKVFVMEQPHPRVIYIDNLYLAK